MPVTPTHPTVCPGCGSRVVEETTLGCCPNCGHHWGLGRLERAVSILDIVAGGTIFVIAVVACLPTTWLLFDVARNARVGADILIAVVWHSWVWGLPVAAVAFAWRDNVLHNRPPGEGLLKVYRRVQLFTLLVPFALAMLVLAVCGLARL